jgi:hypothetical protein
MADKVRSCDKTADHGSGDRDARHHYLSRESRGCRETSDTDPQQHHDSGQRTRAAHGDLQSAGSLNRTPDHGPTLRLTSQPAQPGQPKPSGFLVHGGGSSGLRTRPGRASGRAAGGHYQAAKLSWAACGCCSRARCDDLYAGHPPCFPGARRLLPENRASGPASAFCFYSTSRIGQEILKSAQYGLSRSLGGDDHLRSGALSAWCGVWAIVNMITTVTQAARANGRL